MLYRYDALIIGAGALGCAVAYMLSGYELSVCVIEKEADVASGTSGRNSAVSHAGFNSRRDSLAACYCLRGNRGLGSICRKLNVPFKKTGKLIVATDESDIESLHKLVSDGKYNKVSGLSVITKEEAGRIAPGIPCAAAMFSENTAIFDPFLYAVALAENAAANGADFFFGNAVKNIKNENGVFSVTAGAHTINARYIVNAAGLFASEILRLAGGTYHPVHPCRGEYHIIDKNSRAKLYVPVYPVPKPGIGGLGVHLTPTTGGNIIIGPSAEYINDPEDYACTREVTDNLIKEAKILFPAFNPGDIIRSYSGIRSKLVSSGGFGDFIIGEDEKVPGIFNLIGVESPGLTSSLPIAEDIAAKIAQRCAARRKSKIKTLILDTPFNQLTKEQQHEKIKADPQYGEIICRCEKITKAEIIKALKNPLGVRTIAGIKYRTRASMGRCQGGFCLTRIAAVMINECGMKPEEITYRGKGGEILLNSKKTIAKSENP